MENQTTYRIRTKLGETEPINIPVKLMQEYNSFEILSLKINTNDTYRSYTSTEGIVVGRVSTANNGLGIPNVRVSIFVPKGTYTQSDEEAVLYPFSAPTDMDGDRVRYNLLPSDSDVDCYQVIGTLPTKRKILDNETVCEVFDKFYKYTTVTNEAGDFMLSNIPVGKQRIHIDADLSDIGPFLSQKPYDMIENLGFEKNRFESTRQFKTSKDLDSLAQVITQNKSVYVYPYWGDSTENSAEMKITRTDLSLNYEFKTGAIFIGSVITDKQSNSIRQNCTATENAGKMSDMVTGPGRIEMIRKTIDDKVEQYRIKGDELINNNGVWCYTIPMNLDYVRTDEFGNIVPTDDPNKGVPTRARVRFRITLNEMESDEDAHKRCSYLVPNNPKSDDIKFLQENTADYSFGSDTWNESFVDLFWNKVYTVKNYVPRIQKTVRATNRKHTGVKMVNHFGDNNPFPYNSMSIKLSFLYRLICVIVHIFINLISLLNIIISIIGALPCWLASIKLPLVGRIFKKVLDWIPPCIPLSSEFCDDGINKNVTYPGCGGCVWKNKTKPECDKQQHEISEDGGEAAVCTNSDTELFTCVENQLAQQNEATSFNFGNDWINGCLYMPLWYRKIRPKKSFFFGLFSRGAKDQWCAGENNDSGRQLKMASFCSHSNSKEIETLNYTGEKIKHNITGMKDGCGNGCHEVINWVKLSNGLIMNRENMFGQKVWYYKAVEVESSLNSSFANEYENYNFKPMVSKTLYATDIVLLGSMNDCDLNGIPKFFNYLKGSTYNMPTDILFTDTEIEYKFNEKNELMEQDSHKISVSSGCDWGNPNEYGYYDGGLFYSIGCKTIEVDTASCINLKRICELGVGQDEIQYVENIDVKNETGVGAVSITNENDSLDYNNLEFYLRPDGFISYDDINDFNYRSMFATMNGNNLRTKINTTNGVKEYDFRHLYVDNFDGSLYEIMKEKQSDRGKANYKHNYLLETTNTDYLTFRMGDRPYYYDGKSLVQTDKNMGPRKYTLPKYQNSFYFYFGLKEGKTAIDLFNEQYNGPCLTKEEEQEIIPYEKKANGWCSIDSDDENKFNHESYDGYLKIDFEKLPLPCSAILNSRDNNAVTYTISTLYGDTNIVDEKICFYGSNTSDVNRNMEGYVRYCFHYENTSYDKPVDVEKCYMLNNGEYDMFVTDGEGNQHSFIISIKGTYLQFDDVERKFGQPNNVLMKYYQTVGGEGSAIPYHSVSKSPDPSTEKITIVPDLSGVPFVTREDYSMKYVEKKAILDGNTKKYVRLNGTICLYNIFFDDEPLDKFIIEVEPYDKERRDGEDYYVDKDFWSDGIGKETWYSVKMFNDHEKGIVCKDCSVADGRSGRKFVTPLDDTKYFYYQDITVNETLTVRCYVIKCPKGDVNYRVRVTQLCEKDGVYYKSQNYIERKILVSQPTPYKLLINDADYDIIKNFKTGWNLRNQEPLQTTDDTLLGSVNFRPFTGVGDFSGIKGWLEISDINENYAWGEEPEKYGTEDEKFDKYNGNIKEYEGMYDIEVKLRWKEDAEPKEPQRFNYDDDSKYNEDYNRWLQLHEEWENGCLDENGERSVYYKDISKVEQKKKEGDIGGCCGYRYVKEAAQRLLNRLDFVEKMKSSFWIQCENSDKTISYSVRTDDTPYDVWTIYNPEYESPNDNDYNETDSETKEREKKRHYWKCVGESTQYIEGIKVPNITAFNSKDFGIYEDSVRQKSYPTTYNGEMCFGQDNIAENSIDSGSISIKPPYLVACVNYEGITKPNNLKKENFYSQDSANKYGLTPYKFGDVGSNARWIKDGEYEFFQFYLIDKIFSPDIVTWAYMSNIPYFLPWYEYDTEPQDRNPDSAGNNLGYVIKTSGIVSGFIKNGITSDNGYINDFEQRSIFDKETVIKTYNGDTEDSIPTRRCILYQDDKSNKEAEVYLNYRHTYSVGDSNQFKPVPNREGELDFVDKGGNCETTRTLYGAMKVTLKSTTLNDPLIKNVEIFGKKFTTSVGENGDTSLTLKVGVSNSDTGNPITYYIFETSMKETVPEDEPYRTRKLWYPLNDFYAYTSETPYRYEIDCKDSIKVWDGSTLRAPQVFNKNTLEKHFKDKYDLDSDLVQKSSKSTIVWENEEGAVQTKDTSGYGNTGIFTNLNHKPYFVIAVTENNCRAISPVYDFHVVYYVVGLVEENGQKILRSALVYVLKRDGTCNDPENDGYDPSSIGPYCKKPRNYYLTQFDFTISYTFANGSTLVTNDGITYEKTKVKFKDGTSFDDDDPVGTSYVVENEDGSFTIHTKNGGAMAEGQETTEKPAGQELTQGEYSYETIIVENDPEKGGTTETKGWVTVTVDANGNVSESEPSKTNPGLASLPESGYITITVTDAATGETTTTYKPIAYSTETVTTVPYDPRIPYFIRYNDKSLTDDEFDSLKLLLSMPISEIEKNVKYYVTDVTGLKHRCKLHKIIKNKDDWKKQVLRYPK